MKDLTKAEEQIMQVLWRLKEAFIKDIIDQMPEPKPAYNTVGTFLKILENKAFVKRRKLGNTYVYAPLVAKKDFTKNYMKGFLGKYFEGSAEKLFSFMVQEKDLNIEQIEDLIKKMKDND